MSVLSRLFGRRRETRSDPMPPDSLYNLIDGGSPFAGTGPGYGDPQHIEAVATAQACVSAIASTMASLPPRVYRSGANGDRTEITAGPYAALFRRPHPHLTYPDLMGWLMAQVLVFGNGLLHIESDQAGNPVSLRPIPWAGVNVVLTAAGDLVYDVPNGQGGTYRLLSADTVHVRDRSTGNPLVGTPRLAKCPQVLQAALAAQAFALDVFENGATPSGIVTLPRTISADGFRRAEAAFNSKHTRMRRVLFMDDTSTYVPLNITLENSENLAARKYSADEIARIFQIPAVLAGINEFSTFTNSETAGRFFAQHCIRPWALKVETAIAHVLFPPDSGFSLELDMSAMLRGSDVERWQCWQIAIANNVLSPADVRQAEGWSGEPPAPMPTNQTTPPAAFHAPAEPTQLGQATP